MKRFATLAATGVTTIAVCGVAATDMLVASICTKEFLTPVTPPTGCHVRARRAR
jgi:hypothetical protein